MFVLVFTLYVIVFGSLEFLYTYIWKESGRILYPPPPLLNIPVAISMVPIFFFQIYTDFEFYQLDSLTCSFSKQYSTKFFYMKWKTALKAQRLPFGLGKM